MNIQGNFVFPSDSESRDDVLAIDRRTKEDLRIRHHLYMDTDWKCNTIAFTIIETLVGSMNSQIIKHGVDVLEKGYSLNFYDLIELGVSNKKNKRAEKNGNLNVKFRPGILVDEIISETKQEQEESQYISIAEAFGTGDEAIVNAMLVIDRTARRHIKDKYDIILPQDWEAIATSCIMLENMYRHILMKLTASDKNSVMINYNELFDLHAEKKNDEVAIYFRPGMLAKIGIKNDGATEVDD